MKTYSDIRINARKQLRDAGVEAYNLEANLIVSYAAGCTMPDLLKNGSLYTTDAVAEKVDECVRRRLAGEPVAYVTGRWEFYGVPIDVSPDVLIPRMDTELVIDAAKQILTGRNMQARILDLCCGSGCIACAIARELPASRVVAADISPKALEITKNNAAMNGLSSRVICIPADALTFPPMGLGTFDLILSNPPYIPSGEILGLDASVRDYEPILALDGGEDGLRFYRSIITYWKTQLKENGAIVFEVGEDQAEAVSDMIMSAGFASCSTMKDTLGTDRVVIGYM